MNISHIKFSAVTPGYILGLVAVVMAAISACQPEEFDGNGNGLTSPDLSADFTITPVEAEGKMNTYVFQVNNMQKVIGVKWDLGDGTLAWGYQKTDTVFFPDADTYTITANVIGIGGKTFAASKTLVVEESDPNAGNLLLGGKFNEGDESSWQTLQYSGGVTPVFKSGKVFFEGGEWGHAGIYQAVEVEAGRKYKLDMSVAGSGASDTWFEVYVGTAVPQGGGGNDYSDGGTRLGLNTWSGCGNAAFGDKLSKIACVGSLVPTKGEVEFATSGTWYVVIRTGGANLGTTGISVDNIELRPVN